MAAGEALQTLGCCTRYKADEILYSKSLDKLSKNLMALDRKQHRLVTGIVSGHCTIMQHLHITDLLDSAKCGKCGQEEESYHTICQCTALDVNI
jgi:hypothetical protein